MRGIFCLCGLLLAGCSNSKHAVTQVVSIAAEAQLFVEFVQQGHATATYAKTHPHYLKRLAEAASKDVEATRHEELKRQMQRLNTALAKLANASSDPTALAALHDEFAEIAQLAGQIGESI